MGSDYKKPDATTVITRENYRQLLWPLPVGDMLFVGQRAQKKLEGMGIYTIGELAAAEPALLTGELGKLGAELSRYARGEDTAEVRRWGEKEPVKSIGNGLTFRRNLENMAEVRTALASLAEEVAARLRRHGLYAGAVQVTIKGADLKSIQRQKQLPMATHLARDLEKECLELVRQHWSFAQPIRMLTVTALALTEEPFAVQQSLFGDEPKADPRREALERSLDAIREKYGKNAIGGAALLGNDLGLDSLAIRDDGGESAGENETEDGRQIVKGPRR